MHTVGTLSRYSGHASSLPLALPTATCTDLHRASVTRAVCSSEPYPAPLRHTPDLGLASRNLLLNGQWAPLRQPRPAKLLTTHPAILLPSLFLGRATLTGSRRFPKTGAGSLRSKHLVGDRASRCVCLHTGPTKLTPSKDR